MRFLKGLALAGAVIGLMGTAGSVKAEPREYVMNQEHFAIAFMVQHLGLADTVGMFRDASGSFTFDAETGELSDVVITVQTDSVFTNHDGRDENLRGPDFLNVQEHPTMTFTADGATKTGEKSAKVKGELTMLGRTEPLTLDVTYKGSRKDPFNGDRHTIGISARGTIRRSDYGMTYAVEDNLVGDKIDLIVEFEAIYADQQDGE